MARKFTTQFTVRYDECDAAGDLRASAYLCYTQEAATSDARDRGWTGNPWVIRRTRLLVHQPIRYPDTIAVTTWAMGFSRSLAQRAYEFRNAAGAIIAETQSLWVCLDATTLRPTRIGPEVYAYWFPEGDPSPPPGLPKWPELPIVPPQRTTLTVGYTMLDTLQHVNNARYLDLLDDAGWAVWLAQTAETNIAARPTLQQYDIEYYQPAILGDKLCIDTWLATNQTSLTRPQQITRDGQLLARSQSDFIF